jgi:ABC-type polysaccharide/polyol phosphate transport system ATPase subunit
MSRVRFEGVGKRYALGERMGPRALLARSRPTIEALRDVSFEVARGECLGLVGANGAGKSTVLAMIAGITLPSAGRVEVAGAVLPLLGIGASFHPEFTGRQNVELAGAILGLPRAAVAERLGDIVAMAGVERHVDTPAKRYSWGMVARLSIALALVLPADVYLFDEALAVVDGEFRELCLTQIAQLGDAGRTVLFVSHALDQLEAVCDRVLWLERGTPRMLGPTAEVLAAYA